MAQPQQPNSFVDELIAKVRRSSSADRFPDEISDGELAKLCDAAKNAFLQHGTLVAIQPPVVVCGDVHGQFSDLLRIFNTHGLPSQQQQKQYLFLGDFVDRGPQSLETVILLFCYRVKFPHNFVLLRGNHECSNINEAYGFYDEIVRRYRQGSAVQLFQRFNETFAWMPYVCLIGGRILCVHGGISDRITSLEQLNELPRPQIDPPADSLSSDLTWSLSEPGTRGTHPTTGGAGVVFGEEMVDKICQRLGIDSIIRGHQVVSEGYEYFADGRMLTLHTSPGYCNDPSIKGATLTIGHDFRHNITQFEPE